MSELPAMTSEIRRGVAAPADLRRRVIGAAAAALAVPAHAQGAVTIALRACRAKQCAQKSVNWYAFDDLDGTGHRPSSRRRRLINPRRADDASALPSCP